MGDNRTSAVLYCVFIIDLAKLSDWGMLIYPRQNGYISVVCCEIEHIDHFQPHNNFPAQSLHFRFGSVTPCPTLKSHVTISTPRTRYRRLARPYPTGFSCYTQSAYKSKQGFLRSPEEISYADFSARTYMYSITLDENFMVQSPYISTVSVLSLYHSENGNTITFSFSYSPNVFLLFLHCIAPFQMINLIKILFVNGKRRK